MCKRPGSCGLWKQGPHWFLGTLSAVPLFPIPAEQRIIRGLLARADLAILNIYFRAAAATREAIDLADLVAVLETGYVPTLVEIHQLCRIDVLVDRLSRELAPMMAAAIQRAASIGAEVFARAVGAEAPNLAAFRDLAARSAGRMVGNLIEGIQNGVLDLTTGTRSIGTLEMVQNIIRESFDPNTAGLRTPTQTARFIADVVGLDNRRAKYLGNFSEDLRVGGKFAEKRILQLLERKGADVARLGKDLEQLLLTGELSAKRVAQLYRLENSRLLKSRGETIRRTESLRAATEAQHLIWREAVDRGVLDPETMEREWLPAPNACPECGGLRGARAPLVGGSYPDPGGDGPPGPHPNCRCGERVVRRV